MTITDLAMLLQISSVNMHYFRFVVPRARIHRNVCPRPGPASHLSTVAENLAELFIPASMWVPFVKP